MDSHLDYRKLYIQQQEELNALLAEKDRIEKRILTVRKHLQTLAEICENENIGIERSTEADYLLQHTNLADEIRTILKSAWPGYLQPKVIKADLKGLGRDLSEYQNAQSVIQTVLRRMAESGEVQEGTIPDGHDAGKKTYRIVGPENWNKKLSKYVDDGLSKYDPKRPTTKWK
jgi:hypothetical protein